MAVFINIPPPSPPLPNIVMIEFTIIFIHQLYMLCTNLLLYNIYKLYPGSLCE